MDLKSANSIEWGSLEDILIKLGESLEKPVELVVIGSTVGMSLGQTDRMTLDVDVWKNSSSFDLGVLKRACAKAGIAFDPKSYEEPELPYIQLIEPGIVQIGKFDSTELIFKSGNLELRRPPIANIIASKMVRGESQDYEDSVFLMVRCQVGIDDIEKSIESIEDTTSRENARGNISILRLTFENQTPIEIDPSRPR